MKYTIAAVSLTLKTPSDNESIDDIEIGVEQINPSEKEHPLTIGYSDKKENVRIVTLALMNKTSQGSSLSGQVVTSHCSGSLTETEFETCTEIANLSVTQIFDAYKQCLRKIIL